jgi:uncharacterized protein (DUF433 family)
VVRTSKEGIVSRDPEVMSGELIFTGTRVPAKNLMDYLEAGHTLEEFLDDFPTVSREQSEGYLQMALEAADLARASR